MTVRVKEEPREPKGYGDSDEDVLGQFLGKCRKERAKNRTKSRQREDLVYIIRGRCLGRQISGRMTLAFGVRGGEEERSEDMF